MNIIIVGCGKVGLALTEQLVAEDHNITLIDSDEESLAKALSLFDVQGVCGNGTSYRIQLEAGIEDADLLIAVTDADAINLLCCLIAKKAGDCNTIARVRDPEYEKEIEFIKDELGLSMAINPELASAREISRIIKNPGADDIESLARGEMNLIQFEVPENSILVGTKLMEFQSKVNKVGLVCVIKRDQEVLIPSGSTMIEQDDELYIILKSKDVSSFFKKVGVYEKSVKSCMIAGGGTISYYLAKELNEFGIKTTIIEIDKERADELSELLPDSLIIHGDAGDKQLLLEEGIRQTDAFVSLTNMDEENILLSLYADKVSDAKLITKINKITIKEAIDELPIGTVTSPKDTTTEYILQYVRSQQDTKGSNVENLYRMVDNKVEALEFFVKDDSLVTACTLAELKLKPNVLIASINRNKDVIIPLGHDKIQKNDRVVIITTNLGLNSLDDILM